LIILTKLTPVAGDAVPLTQDAVVFPDTSVELFELETLLDDVDDRLKLEVLLPRGADVNELVEAVITEELECDSDTEVVDVELVDILEDDVPT